MRRKRRNRNINDNIADAETAYGERQCEKRISKIAQKNTKEGRCSIPSPFLIPDQGSKEERFPISPLCLYF
jgi:hypothetical protein